MIIFRNSLSERPPSVLLIDPQQWSARALGSVLSSEGYEVTHFVSASDALSYLSSNAPDVIFVEAHINASSGLDLCRTLRSHANVGSATPILLTTAAPARREERLAALRAGAWDLLVMPTDMTELLLRLETFVCARTEVLLSRARSLLDPETDLYSTRGLLRRLRELSLDAVRHRIPVACVVVGHDRESGEGGDERLERLMQRATRASDAVAKTGQAEYAIVASRTDSAAAVRLAQRLYQTAQDGSVSPDRPLHLCIGCYALQNFNEPASADDILARATAALREAQVGSASAPICVFNQPAD